MTKRNGKVEFLRFAFSMCVLLFHLNLDIYNTNLYIGEHLSFFKKGNLGVEFFFLLSGFLLAKSAFKVDNSGKNLGQTTISYLKNKLLALLPFHLIVFPITFIVILIKDQATLIEFFKDLIKIVPSFLCLDKFGFPAKVFMGVEWYIGSMLVSMLIIYPLCKTYKETFTNIIAPVIAIFSLGYLLHEYKSLGTVGTWVGFTFKGEIRALAEISLGTTCFAVSRKLSQLNFTKTDKKLMTAIEFLCFAFCFFFICSRISPKYSSVFILAVFLGLALIFSSKTYGTELFNNKFVFYLGKLSLPIYIGQCFIRPLVPLMLPNIGPKPRLIISTFAAVLFGMLVHELSKPLAKAIDKKIKDLYKAD